MTDSIGDILNIKNSGEFSTKKVAKKTEDKALSLKERKGKVRVSQPQPKVNSEMNGNTDDSQKEARDLKSNTRINARKNAEIDEYLLGLLMTDLIDESYWKFHTKCLHVIGLQRYNTLVIEARAGRNPKHLLAFKLKGALELHYKKQLYREKYNLS